MKKLVLVLVVALIAVPAFAADPVFTESAKNNATKTVTVGYDATGAALPRGFGLVLEATGGNIVSVTATKEGESTAAAKGYGIFPGTIVIVDGAVTDYNTPVEPNNLPGGPSVLGTPRVVVALGSLYVGDANKPDAAGDLFTVVCSAGTSKLTVSEEDAFRGGVVDVNANAMTVAAKEIEFVSEETIIGTPVVTKTTAAPAVADKVNGGRLETFVASGVAGSLGGSLEYQFTWGDAVVGPWGAATQTHTYAYTATGNYTVTVQARLAAAPAVLSAVSAGNVVTRETVKASATTIYAAWADFSRPNCWAFQRSCRGDVNGGKSGFGTNILWVDSADLTIFKAAYNKVVADLKLVNVNGTPGICADNNRGKSGFGANILWVDSADLTVFKQYYNQVVANVPVCSQANYWFWTN